MSIRVMNFVWQNSRSKNGARLVLLALADFADDGGGAYPSIASLVKKTLLSERAVQAGLKELVLLNELTVKPNEARRGCNYYIVTTTPADSAPPQILHPANPAPVQILPQYPADSAPEPSGEPSGEETPLPPSAPPPVAGAEKKERKPKAVRPAHPPDPRFTPVTDGYCAAYLETFGSPYVHNGGRDGKKLKQFLITANPEEFTTTRILKIAKAAMKRGGEPFAKATKFASSLHGFCDQFNAIRAELIAMSTTGTAAGFSLSAAAPEKVRDPTADDVIFWVANRPEYVSKRAEWTSWDRLPPFARDEFWQHQRQRKQAIPTPTPTPP